MHINPSRLESVICAARRRHLTHRRDLTQFLCQLAKESNPDNFLLSERIVKWVPTKIRQGSATVVNYPGQVSSERANTPFVCRLFRDRNGFFQRILLNIEVNEAPAKDSKVIALPILEHRTV